MATAADLTTAAECATRWGISRSTARRYLAPLTPVDRDPVTGAMRYHRTAADEARAALPGRGARTDLATIAKVLTDDLAPAVTRVMDGLAEMDPTPAADRLRTLKRGIPSGQPFPAWAVPTRRGRLIALLTETPWDRDTPWHHTATLQDDAYGALVMTGLISQGDEEEVPEYYGRRQGLRWEPGRTGWPIALTEKGCALVGAAR